MNIAHEAVVRHAHGPRAEHVAFRFLAEDLSRRDVTYAELERLTARFTDVLRALGVGRADRMFVLTGRIPELYVGVLGALRNGTTVTPLFSAFDPGPIATRMRIGEGSVLLTTATTYRRKVARTRRCCTSPAAPPARRRVRCTCTARW